MYSDKVQQRFPRTRGGRGWAAKEREETYWVIENSVS